MKKKNNLFKKCSKIRKKNLKKKDRFLKSKKLSNLSGLNNEKRK